MKQAIIAFHQDKLEHWLADLACGHTRMYVMIHPGNKDCGLPVKMADQKRSVVS